MIVDMDKDFQYTLGDQTDCYMDPTYWLPILLESYSEGTYQWTNDANFEMEEIKRIVVSAQEAHDQLPGFALITTPPVEGISRSNHSLN